MNSEPGSVRSMLKTAMLPDIRSGEPAATIESTRSSVCGANMLTVPPV